MDSAGLSRWPEVVIGHSFGGKVALDLLRRAKESGGLHAPARDTWVLDALPGATDGNKSLEPQSVSRVLSELRQITPPFASRSALVRDMKGRGFSEMLAQWMTTNTKAAKDGTYEWAFDLDTIETLFADYRAVNYWGLLRELEAHNSRVHFVRAGLNTAWTPAVLNDFETAMGGSGDSNISLHHIPDSGHWVHVEALEEVARLIEPTVCV